MGVLDEGFFLISASSLLRLLLQ